MRNSIQCTYLKCTRITNYVDVGLCQLHYVRKQKGIDMDKQLPVIHGMQDTPEYGTWNSMRMRCLSPNAKSYKDYGGRGITVCNRWSLFSNFIADMGKKPSPKHSLDRINNK